MNTPSHQGYNHTDSFGDNDTLARRDSRTDFHDFHSFQGLSHHSDDTGKQLPYVDEDFNRLPNSQKNLEDSQYAPLVHNAADIGRSSNYHDLGRIPPCCFSNSHHDLLRIRRTS